MTWTVIVFGGKEQPPLDQQETWKPLSYGNEVRKRISSQWQPVEIGSGDEVRRNISTHLPGVEWTSPYWGICIVDGLSFEFDLGADESAVCLAVKEPVTSFGVHVRGEGNAIACLMRFALPNRWQLLDGWTGKFINLDSPSAAGWIAWQEYWRDVDRFFDSVTPLRSDP